MKYIVFFIGSLLLAFSDVFAQQPISVTKHSKIEQNSAELDGIKIVYIQSELVPYNPNLIAPKSIQKPENAPVEDNIVVIEKKDLVPFQEREAFKQEKQVIPKNTNSVEPPQNRHEELKPVLLLPYQPSVGK